MSTLEEWSPNIGDVFVGYLDPVSATYLAYATDIGVLCPFTVGAVINGGDFDGDFTMTPLSANNGLTLTSAPSSEIKIFGCTYRAPSA
jgi:hypothetical protein